MSDNCKLDSMNLGSERVVDSKFMSLSMSFGRITLMPYRVCVGSSCQCFLETAMN
jgi:hypothetical protein